MQADSHSREQNPQPRRLFWSVYIFIHEFSGLSIFLGPICRCLPRVLSAPAREMSFLLHKPPVERSAIIYPAEDESAATTCSTECPQEFTRRQQKMSARGEHDDKVLFWERSGPPPCDLEELAERFPRKQVRQIMNHASPGTVTLWICLECGTERPTF